MSHLLSGSQNCTPETGLNLKNTSCRSGRLNKSLFTPCRRLGLSRHFKATPNSSRNHDYSPNSSCLSTPSNSISQVEINIETPTNEKSKDAKNDTDINFQLLSKEENTIQDRESVSKNKKSVKKTKKSITCKNTTNVKEKPSFKEFDSMNDKTEHYTVNIESNVENPKHETLTTSPEIINEKQTSEPVSKNKKSVKNTKKSITCKNKTNVKEKPSFKEFDSMNDKTEHYTVNIESNVENLKYETLTTSPEIINEKQTSEVEEIKNLDTKGSFMKQLSGSSSNSESDQPISNQVDSKIKKESTLVNSQVLKDIQTLNVNTIKKTKSSFAKRLSMKKTSSQDDLTDKEDLLSTPKSSTSSLAAEEVLKDCSVDLEKMVSLEETELVSKNAKKKRRIICSSDEDDFLSSQLVMKKQNENQQQDDENWDERINEIHARIKKKKEHLEELKRAAIYKRLHNVTELNKATEIWKKGCQDGLIHLLQKTREHVEIDMPTLMKNLNIPPTIVYSKETDSFM